MRGLRITAIMLSASALLGLALGAVMARHFGVGAVIATGTLLLVAAGCHSFSQ